MRERENSQCFGHFISVDLIHLDFKIRYFRGVQINNKGNKGDTWPAFLYLQIKGVQVVNNSAPFSIRPRSQFTLPFYSYDPSHLIELDGPAKFEPKPS